MSENSRAVNALLGRMGDAEAKLMALEMARAAQANEIATLKDLIQRQTQVIGQALQSTHGTGPTVKE